MAQDPRALELCFLGTRGLIPISTRSHRLQTSTLLAVGNHRVLIDCGETWLGRLEAIRPDAILLTHAHEDHAGALKAGSPCRVYASAQTWQRIRTFPVAAALRRVIEPRKPFDIASISFEAFPVVHSLRAPAVGYRISLEKTRIFYVPDVLEIPERRAALLDVSVYVGDGASLARPIMRRARADLRRRIGHAPIVQQLTWCSAEGVPRMIVTHCGSQIVRSDGRRMRTRLRKLGRALGVDVLLAHDGLKYQVPQR
jgi:phosphoribosyl 1,2-cyclic phosphodiesterase